MPLLERRESGLYCAAGDFYIDPWAAVDRAVITHAHPDRAHPGSGAYLATPATGQFIRLALGAEASIQGLGYGQSLTLGGARISLHPAGHILGSAQVRIDVQGEVWVVAGDYQLAPDPTCAPFEPLRCHTFVTEATFALPIFRWPDQAQIRDAVHSWWRGNQEAGRISLLFGAPLGTAQRLLALLGESAGPIYAHSDVDEMNRIYRQAGVELPRTALLVDQKPPTESLVLAPASARSPAWERQFGTVSTALASGWMRIRGPRRRRSLDRGFALSGHADWPALLRAIDESRAECIWVTHGFRLPLVRWLQEHGRQAVAIETPFEEAEP